MTHFGILCPNATGHLNPAIALAKELQRRGHQITFFQVLDGQAKIEAAGLGFHAIGASELPKGSTRQTLKTLGTLSSLAAMNYSIRWIQQTAEVFFNEAPAAIRAMQVDALLVDQVSPEGASIAEFLEIPFISLCCALPINQDISVPPFVTPWHYSPSRLAILRNRMGYTFLKRMTKPIMQTINQHRQQLGLPLYQNPREGFSNLAQISQQPVDFEFPRQDLPETFHFAGPFLDDRAREPIDFPFEKLTGQPLIYASLGTLQNQQMAIFHRIAQACADLPVQLVISLGNSDSQLPSELLGSPIVVAYAPQLELLKKATLTITHAGLNTVLESLANGVPMVAIPITNDQPAVGARLARTGAGVVVPLSRLSVPRLRTAVRQILAQESYRNNAQQLQASIQKTNGVRYAADIVERSLAAIEKQAHLACA
jgi:zeaxanthin glucosyltransferase